MIEPNQLHAPKHPSPTRFLPRAKPLGQLLIALELLDPPQLARLLEIQKGQPPGKRQPLGRICVEQGLLSRERLDHILDRWGKRLRIGELLVNRGKVTPAQLDVALEERRRRGCRLGEALLALGFVDEYTLTEALGEQHDLPYVPLMDLSLDPELVRYVNPQFASRNGVVPIGKIGRRLTVAIHDPTRTDLIRDLERSTGLQVQAVLATPQEVHDLGRRLYDFASDDENEEIAEGDAPDKTPSRELQSLSIVVESARAQGATEILLEPTEDGGRVRMRRDDVLRPMQGAEMLRGRIPDLVKLLKTVALLDPADERRLQEGFFRLEADEQESSFSTAIRLRTQPGRHGESAHLGLFPGSQPDLSFDEIGLSDAIRGRLSTLITETHGVVLLVGPAGSGKRSTLRGCVDLLRRCDRPIVTVEDLAGGGAGNESAVLVLERLVDAETARSVFTIERRDFLILGILQAGNTMSAIQRLLTCGVPPARIGAALSGVLTQRLVRRVCPECEQTYEPRRSVLDEWFRCEPPFSRWRRGAGCVNCDGTGFAGRMAVAELWVPTPEERVRIGQATDVCSLREAALQRSRCIGQDALEQVIQGHTTLEEALKQVPYEDVVYTRLHGLEMDKAGRDDLREAI